MITDTETPKYNDKQIGGNDQLEQMPPKDKQTLYNEIITTVHNELGEEFRNKKDQYILNMRNIALDQTDWESVGKQVTTSILDKINNILQNINFSIVADDKNNYNEPPLAPQPIPEATISEAPKEEEKEKDPVDIQPVAQPQAEAETVNDTDTVAEPEPKPNETLQVDTEEKKVDTALTGGEKLPVDWIDPPLSEIETQNGGTKKDNKKRQTIRIKYLSKNKTRKNII